MPTSVLTSLVKQLFEQLGPGMAVTTLHPSGLGYPILESRRAI